MASAGSGSGSATAPTKRLIITRMVLENFKSYAGVQSIGPFHHSFSSVVGSFSIQILALLTSRSPALQVPMEVESPMSSTLCSSFLASEPSNSA
jgi:hypothetical protein